MTSFAPPPGVSCQKHEEARSDWRKPAGGGSLTLYNNIHFTLAKTTRDPVWGVKVDLPESTMHCHALKQSPITVSLSSAEAQTGAIDSHTRICILIVCHTVCGEFSVWNFIKCTVKAPCWNPNYAHQRNMYSHFWRTEYSSGEVWFWIIGPNVFWSRFCLAINSLIVLILWLSFFTTYIQLWILLTNPT